ncbi:photosystem I assembly protein Ycf3 [Gimesia alba]|uniref:Photosystem I assembly protein Ycf3 n=1 Tax=Gimesia alba TaxID=2527973 RepID=A0A517RIZ7_9PLAN|nr:tetratricopeptide repeat protein [Gimesia alba]QDT43849.1 photosystem I assembly protein Ycf3 [Gimesia alba]
MRNQSKRPLSWMVLCLFSLSGCIPVYMTAPEHYKPLSYFRTLDDAGEYQERLAKYNLAIDANSGDVDALFGRAVLYMGVGRYTAAKEDLDQAIQQAEKQPDYNSTRLASIYVHRGLLRWDNEQVDLAIADYSEAIELKPDDWEAYFHRWLAYQFQGEEEKAKRDRERGKELMPNVFEKEYSFTDRII